MAESTSKLRQEIKALSGVDIMKNTKEYKSTYDIFKEISQVWNQISDVSQANILEKFKEGGRKMGYYADAEGFIVAKDIDSYQKLEEILGYGPATNDTPFNFWKDADTLTFNLSNADEKYWDDEVTDFLYQVSEFICEGEVDYVGEDHELWRFIFDADTHQWREESGQVVYGETSPSGLSDEDLIKEIQKRGYTAQKVILSDYINN